MILRGVLLGIIHSCLFYIFYTLGILPHDRFYLAICHVVAFLLMSFLVVRYLIDIGKSNYLVTFLSALMFLSCSSLTSMSFEYVFHSKIDPEYKFILAKERVEQINGRRSKRGISDFESVDFDAINKSYTLLAYGKNFGTSSIVNSFFSLIILFSVAPFYKKVVSSISTDSRL
jgi:hypothetical protein